MNSKNAFLLFGFIGLLIAYIIYNEKIVFSGNEGLNEVNFNNKNLKHIDAPFPISHILKLNDELLICSGLSYPQIFITKEYLSNPISNGALFLYNTKSNELNQISIENFPNSIPFHPHGIGFYKESSEKYYLYIINHSIREKTQENEERIEKILLEIDYKHKKVSLSFKSYATLPQSFFGTLNSLAVIDLNTIYFTTQNYFSLPSYIYEQENYKSYLYLIKAKLYNWMNIIIQKLNLKKANLYSYNWENGKINVIQNSEGLSNNGLAFNKQLSLLYMASSHEKVIKVFEISRNEPTKALYINSIKTIYNVGNIFYDNEKEIIYAGIFGSTRELINLEKNYIINGNFDNVTTYGGFEEINIKNNYEIDDLIVMKNQLKGIYSAIKINNKIYLSSNYQKGLLVLSK